MTACGGGSSSSSDENDTGTLTGHVIDPAIVGATVELRNAEGTALAAVTITDEQGYFALNYNATTLNGAILTARGGVDQATGYSFANAILRAPADTPNLIVSPLTELVTGLMVADGATQQQAISTVAEWFGLETTQVLSDPREHAPAQRASLQLSALIHALRKESAPLEKVLAALSASSGDLDIALAELQTVATATDTADYLDATQQLLAALPETVASAADAVSTFNQINIRTGISQYFAPGGTSDPTILTNLNALADALWTANTGQGVPFDGPELANLIRYLISAHGLQTTDFADEDFTVPVIDAASVDSILQVRGAIDHTLPLPDEQLLGNDSAKRLAYFYGSDLSPFYRAEQIVKGIYDDTLLDPVYQSIAEGQARVGLLDDALVTLNTRLFQTSARLNGQRLVGRALGEIGRTDDAEVVLLQGLDSANQIIAARGGAGSITAAEATLLIHLTNAASSAGLPQVANQVLEPLRDYAEANKNTYTTTAATILSALSTTATMNGGRPVPDAVVAYETSRSASDLANAGRLVGIYEEIIGKVPPQTSGSRAINAMNLAQLADYQDRIGQIPWDTVDAYLAIVEGTIPGDGQTATHRTTSAGYFRWLADVYGRNDKVTEYLTKLDELALAVTGVRNAMSTSNKTNALTAIAPWQAIVAIQNNPEQGVQAGIDIAINGLTDLSAQVDALLWTGINQGNQGLTLRLAQQGHATEAAAVIQYVQELIAKTGTNEWQTLHADDPAKLVTQGCGKVAWAWYRIGETTRGLQEAANCYDFIDAYGWSSNSKKVTAFQNLVTQTLGSERMEADGFTLTAAAAQRVYALTTDYSDLTWVAQQAAWAGNDVLAADALADAYDSLLSNVSLPIPDSDDNDTRLPKITSVLAYVGTPQAVINNLRGRIALDGMPDQTRLALIEQARRQIRDLLLDEARPFATTVAALTDSSARKAQLTSLATRLANAGLHDEALAAAGLQATLADRNATLEVIADILVNATAFPDSLYATEDRDGDGLPDFFNPVPAALEAGNPFTLDDDIDGDGCMDTLDRRPFLFTAGTADCQ